MLNLKNVSGAPYIIQFVCILYIVLFVLDRKQKSMTEYKTVNDYGPIRVTVLQQCRIEYFLEKLVVSILAIYV